MMPVKRKLPVGDDALDASHDALSKRPRLADPFGAAARPPSRDILSTLSDELLVRILSFLSETVLLGVSPVSRRFCRLASDSQLWRAHYYTRFVLPRAMRIPGFRAGSPQHGVRLRYSSRKTVLMADGPPNRRGSLADDVKDSNNAEAVDWRRQYKLRHNWARGKCAVEEVSVRDAAAGTGTLDGQARTLVKVVEGIAVTADSASGLRAWHLRTRQRIAQAPLCLAADSDQGDAPKSLAVDEHRLPENLLDVLVGFEHGGFGVWTLDLSHETLSRQYRHESSTNGAIVSVAYGHPHVLTATTEGLISLYTFDQTNGKDNGKDSGQRPHPMMTPISNKGKPRNGGKAQKGLTAPYLLTSLRSHSSPQPLALSIRRLATSVSASIAYTFDSRDGLCIGVQDILVNPTGPLGSDELSSRLAFTVPIKTGLAAPPRPPLDAPPEQSQLEKAELTTTLCYSHPYLLAALPDNTLVLHLCTSTATSLTLSPGIRLWGHTSGISDAEITPRGKAVSISSRGDEMRLWELEGRLGGSSIEVRPRQPAQESDATDRRHVWAAPLGTMDRQVAWDDRRNWVGFDDEMVIVLKEARDGRESLVVYDFT